MKLILLFLGKNMKINKKNILIFYLYLFIFLYFKYFIYNYLFINICMKTNFYIIIIL